MTLWVGVSFLALAAASQPQSAEARQSATQQSAPSSSSPQPAQQQTVPAETDTRVGDVQVTARRGETRSSIDATSYSLADDLQAATGTLADVLRNVPSVDVDPEGNVSLRGDPSVTILVDGRPSAVLSGEGRAQAVLQLPADQYSRVEVMTNPSAAYRPDGSGGVINLITKPTSSSAAAAPTVTGSVRATIGDDGRHQFGLNLTETRGKLTLSGNLSYRYDEILQVFDKLRERSGAGPGEVFLTRQDEAIDETSTSRFGRFSAEYRLTDRTSLTGEVRVSGVDNESPSYETFRVETVGSPSRSFLRDTDGAYRARNAGVTGRLLHQLDDQGHEWSSEIRLDRSRNSYSQLTAITDLDSAGPVLYDQASIINNLNLTALNASYVRPTSDGGKLRAGYELEHRDLAASNLFRRGSSPEALVVDPLATNRFDVDQAVHAVYGTIERPFGKLTAQAGLRLEYTDLQLDQITSGRTVSNDYFKAYPTLHLGYQLTEEQTLRASFSRRVQRPQPIDLNPFIAFTDPFNFRSGNPDLEPQETNSFELMWQRRVQQTFYQATAFYRDTSKAFSQVTQDFGGGRFLTRPENLGARQDLGLELVANGSLHPTLRYSANVTVARQQVEAGAIVGGRDAEATVFSARGSLNWQPTAADFLQVTAGWNGDTLEAQGIREATGLVNVGYRRKLTPKLSFQATVRDLFERFGDVTTYETGQFRERVERRVLGRAWYVGLTYSLGNNARAPEPQFDFSPPPSS